MCRLRAIAAARACTARRRQRRPRRHCGSAGSCGRCAVRGTAPASATTVAPPTTEPAQTRRAADAPVSASNAAGPRRRRPSRTAARWRRDAGLRDRSRAARGAADDPRSGCAAGPGGPHDGGRAALKNMSRSGERPGVREDRTRPCFAGRLTSIARDPDLGGGDMRDVQRIAIVDPSDATREAAAERAAGHGIRLAGGRVFALRVLLRRHPPVAARRRRRLARLRPDQGPAADPAAGPGVPRPADPGRQRPRRRPGDPAGPPQRRPGVPHRPGRAGGAAHGPAAAAARPRNGASGRTGSTGAAPRSSRRSSPSLGSRGGVGCTSLAVNLGCHAGPGPEPHRRPGRPRPGPGRRRRRPRPDAPTTRWPTWP